MQETARRKQLLATIGKLQEKERYDLAHELHDNVNVLTTCKLLLDHEVRRRNSAGVQNAT